MKVSKGVPWWTKAFHTLPKRLCQNLRRICQTCQHVLTFVTCFRYIHSICIYKFTPAGLETAASEFTFTRNSPPQPPCHMSGYYWASFLVQNLGDEKSQRVLQHLAPCCKSNCHFLYLTGWKTRWKKGVQAVHVWLHNLDIFRKDFHPPCKVKPFRR